jgi:hypothetical protein
MESLRVCPRKSRTPGVVGYLGLHGTDRQFLRTRDPSEFLPVRSTRLSRFFRRTELHQKPSLVSLSVQEAPFRYSTGNP